MAERAVRGGPPPMPAGLSNDWPVAWQPVEGEEGGVWRDVEATSVRALLATAARLPEPVLRGLVAVAARVARRFDAKRSAAARRFLTTALGSLSPGDLEGRVLQAYRHFFQVVVDSDRFLRRVPAERILEHFDVQWSEGAARLRSEGRGFVMVSPHVGNWEMTSLVSPWLGFEPLYAVAKPMKSKPLSAMAQRLRESRGLRLLPRRGAMAAAPRIIEAGGVVGLLLDQRARKRPVLAPFFGRPARCDRSAGVLLRRLRAPVLPVACYLTPRPLHYRLELHEPIWPEEFEGADPVEVATRINRVLEGLILAHPDQYFWLHDRFRDTPEMLSAEEEAEPEDRDGRGADEPLSLEDERTVQNGGCSERP